MKLRWVAAILAAVVVVAALTSVASAAFTSTATPTYPAQCQRVVACVDNHLNNLDARIHKQHNLIVRLQAQVTDMANKLACWGNFNVVQYPSDPHGSGTPSALGNTLPGNNTDGPFDQNGHPGTWLDLERPDSPANNTVYSLIRNYCQ